MSVSFFKENASLLFAKNNMAVWKHYNRNNNAQGWSKKLTVSTRICNCLDYSQILHWTEVPVGGKFDHSTPVREPRKERTRPAPINLENLMLKRRWWFSWSVVEKNWLTWRNSFNCSLPQVAAETQVVTLRREKWLVVLNAWLGNMTLL